MKKGRKWKTLLAGIFLSLAVAIPLGLTVDVLKKPTLSFEGAEINMMADGSAQLLFTVYVSNVRYSDGARFMVDYNPQYMQPSNHETNTVLTPVDQSGIVSSDAAFAVSPELYKIAGEAKNPFSVQTEKKNFIDTKNGLLSMELWTDPKLKVETGCGLELVEIGEGEAVDQFVVFDAVDKKVALGSLSFRITDLNLLPEIVKQFQNITLSGETVPDAHLLWFSSKAVSEGAGPWAIGACFGEGVRLLHRSIDSATVNSPVLGLTPAQSTFTFAFPETVTGVRAAEADLTLDAYRGYTNGDVGDVALAMQKYSPTVIATYADGSQRSFILPWDGCAVTGDYKPQQGDYKVSQNFTYTNAKGEDIVFPVPVEARLKVTPITLLGMTAEDLDKTYALKNELVDVDRGVQSVSQFKLPTQARLVTDVPAGGASLVMAVPGWSPTKEGSRWPAAGEEMKTLLADESTADRPVHWPVPGDADNWTTLVDSGPDTVSSRRKGTYTFRMAETYGGAARNFAQAEILAAYPWLTVPSASYTLPDATRRLVGETELIEQNRYIVKYVSTVTDVYGNPALTLEVSRNAGGGATLETMETGAQFRVRLPDGTELGTGLDSNGAVGGKVKLDDWFANSAVNHAGYATQMVKVGDYDAEGYHLTTTPGYTGSDSGLFAGERESLRRQINLGGWFYIAINEDPESYAWSDFLPVYVPPRDNLYLESKEYNFVGPNAGLYPWAGGLGNTVALPKGSYQPVDAAGAPLYETDSKTRLTQRYGVPTTYDGATGAEPGELNTFTINSDPGWSASETGGITTYGAAKFLHGALYAAFGNVQQEAGAEKTATVRTQKAIPAAQEEGITLTYAGTSGVTIVDGNVDTVTFDTRTQGYTARQDYTLTITNVGTTDIYGLDVDTLTDAPPDRDGGHFVLLKPPAAFLPAGGSTTFTLTYVYGLGANGGTAVDYKDKLYITSNSKRTTPGVEKSDYLLDFDAQFQVSAEDIHRVTVKVDPADGCMGTARVIIGEVEKDGSYTMDTTPGTTTFRKDDKVYILVAPADEYKLDTIKGVDGSGADIDLIPYNEKGDGTAAGSAKLPKGVEVYSFTMPDYDATITVKLHEPISSKLRLSAMKAYADKNSNLLKPVESNPAEYAIWQKTFSEKEQKAAEDWEKSGGVQGEYLMTCGTANKKGLTELGKDKTVEQYLVVIPAEADYAQVEVTLRQVVYTLEGANPDITPTVSMFLYETSPVEEKDYTPTPDGSILEPKAGDTAIPTTHCSIPFQSPAPGASKFVKVEVAYKASTATDTDTRSYYLEIHRVPEQVIAELNYGNSPYGMIMNDPNIDGETKDDKRSTAKDRAKAAFVDNGYSFHNLPDGVPKVVTDNGLGNMRYWTEAWVDVSAAYEPESGLGAELYYPADNLDLNDASFFAILGEAFLDPGLAKALDSSGRPADISKAIISLTAMTLDDGATEQIQRFQGPDPANEAETAARTVTLELGEAGKLVAKGWEDGKAIRPGLYTLEYHFPDYDGETVLTVSRPFVVLAPVGDVNADAKVTTGVDSDESAVKSRVTLPLGYTAGRYPNAAIFKFRTCDVNNDRNINNIDANTIRAAGKGTQTLGRFYLPTGYKPSPSDVDPSPTPTPTTAP